MKPSRARPGRFSLLDIRDVEHLIVHGEFHLVAGEGEAVDPLRVLLVPGPGIQGQHLPQSIPPVRGEPLQQSGGKLHLQRGPGRLAGEAALRLRMAVPVWEIGLDVQNGSPVHQVRPPDMEDRPQGCLLYTSLGITPGFSGTQRLPRRVGIAKAKELIFSGKTIGAQEAKEIGLVNAVYAPEELMNGAVAMAKSFMVNAPIAVKYAKACIDRGMQMDIDDGIAVENELFAMCFATEDQKEGMGAFLEKRKEKHFQNK